jgi:tetratricopeptide (TPR) repeat protein
MKNARGRNSPQRPPRRWRTPPPITRGSESLEGMEILREVGGDLGVLLWQSYRNVMFWASAEAGERGALFSERAAERRLDDLSAAMLPEPLRAALTAVAGVLGAPEETGGEAVADACTDVARWAEAEDHPSTALAFTQAAAMASQRSARLSLAVGQLARRRGDAARAETWFRHTVMVARQIGDWDSYGRAYIALGNMLVLRGNFPAAQRMHVKALRAARRKGLQEVQAMALHDLFTIAVETGRRQNADDFARQAFRAYGAGHPKIPILAHDVAYYWIEQGFFRRALDVLQALEPAISDARERMSVAASLGRAAGSGGRREVFQRVWTQVRRLAREPGMEAVAPGCLLDLALGAAALGDRERAESAAREAFDLAGHHRQAKVRLRAEALLEEMRRPAAEGEAVGAPAPAEPSSRVESLAGELVRSLQRRRAIAVA